MERILPIRARESKAKSKLQGTVFIRSSAVALIKFFVASILRLFQGNRWPLFELLLFATKTAVKESVKN